MGLIFLSHLSEIMAPAPDEDVLACLVEPITCARVLFRAQAIRSWFALDVDSVLIAVGDLELLVDGILIEVEEFRKFRAVRAKAEKG